MTLISDVRRMLRGRNRVRSLTREIRRLADSNDLIARALSVIVREQWGIDLSAPVVFEKQQGELGEEAVQYVNDLEQAIRETEAEMEREMAGATDDRSIEQRMLDEVE